MKFRVFIMEGISLKAITLKKMKFFAIAAVAAAAPNNQQWQGDNLQVGARLSRFSAFFSILIHFRVTPGPPRPVQLELLTKRMASPWLPALVLLPAHPVVFLPTASMVPMSASLA